MPLFPDLRFLDVSFRDLMCVLDLIHGFKEQKHQYRNNVMNFENLKERISGAKMCMSSVQVPTASPMVWNARHKI